MNTLVIDISSAAISAGVVRNSHKALPEIISCSKSMIHFEHKPSQDEMAKTFIFKVDESLSKLKKDISVEKIIISLGDELHDGSIKSNMIKLIEDKVCKHFGIKQGIDVEGFMQILSKVVHHSFPNTASILQVNMSGESTNFQFVHLGKLGSSIPIEFGLNTIIREVKQEFGLSTNSASSYLSLFSNGSLDATITHKIDDILLLSEEAFKGIWDKTEHFKIDSPYVVYLVAESPFEKVAQIMVEGILPNAVVHVLGVENKFIYEICKFPKGKPFDQKLAVLGAFSNLLI